METNSRTAKSFKNLAAFAEEVLVQCPHCKKQAMVYGELGSQTVPYPFKVKAKFRCSHCYKPIDEEQWYGPMTFSPAYGNCGYCGMPLKYCKTVNKYQDKIEAICPNCLREKIYDASCRRIYANDKQATDPYFGLQLWLQIPVDQNIFWAYNYEHLEYLKNYVAAKLREAPSGGKYSLVWKLPNSIKVAKNRGKILKAISRLESK